MLDDKMKKFGVSINFYLKKNNQKGEIKEQLIINKQDNKTPSAPNRDEQ